MTYFASLRLCESHFTFPWISAFIASAIMARDIKSFLNAAKKSLLVDGHACASRGMRSQMELLKLNKEVTKRLFGLSDYKTKLAPS
jgi:hypothetical protein